jgi:hypothetical protein
LKKNRFYFWASDLRENSGEGILGNQFLSDIRKYNKKSILININTNINDYNTFFNKYILIFFGAIKLWKYYLKGYKIIYINYLPIWNFIIFLILPPKTFFGPITGTLLYNKESLLDYICRGILLNVLKNISLFIIFSRKKRILFSTELLKQSIKKNKHKECYFNYILQTFTGFSNKKSKRKIDFLIYNRDHKNKNNSLIKNFIKNSGTQYKIVVVGDPINLKNVCNKGYISRDKLKLLLENTKYTFGSRENLYTLFVLDSISKGVFIFYDKRLKIYNSQIRYNNMLAIDFNDISNSIKYIDRIINRKKILKNKNYFIAENYEKYFKNNFKK